MKAFAKLLETLALTPSRNRKIAALTEYFAATPDPDRGYALAVLTGALSFDAVKAGRLKDVVLAEVDPHLFALSYDYVGDLGETIALIWPHKASPGKLDTGFSSALAPEKGSTRTLPRLSDLVEILNTTAK